MDFKKKLREKTDLVRIKVMRRVTDAISEAQHQGRLVFESDGQVVYIDKGGSRQVYTIRDVAVLFWDKMNTELTIFNPQAALALLDISVDDILKVVERAKGGTKQR